MQMLGQGRKVTVFIGAIGGHSAAQTCRKILEHLKAEGASAVAAYHATMAIDVNGRVEIANFAEITTEKPIILVWIDSAARVERILPQIAELLHDGLITVDPTEVVLDRTSQVADLPKVVIVGDVMTRDVVSVHPETPIRELVDDLVERSFRAVPVIDADRRVVGMVTNGDLVRHGGVPMRLELLRTFDTPMLHEQLMHLTAEQRIAGDVMTAPAVTITPDVDVRHAAALMLQRKLKRLPVVDSEGRLLGIVSRVDLLHTVSGGTQTVPPPEQPHAAVSGTSPVRELMSTVVPTVRADAPLAQVANVVASTRLNRAIVVDNRRHVLGIVTDVELVERLTPQARPGIMTVLAHRIPLVHGSQEMESLAQHTRGQTAQDVMRTDVLVQREDQLVRDVLAEMLRQQRKLVPIVNERDELVGMVDRADLLRNMVEG